MTKKNDRKQVSKPSTKKKPLDASTREALENRIKKLEAENEKLTIQKMFWEQLRSLEREEAMKKGEDHRQTPRKVPTKRDPRRHPLSKIHLYVPTEKVE